MSRSPEVSALRFLRSTLRLLTLCLMAVAGGCAVPSPGHEPVSPGEGRADGQALINLESPRPEEKVGSSFEVRGRARGSWYFEGDFPVILTDWDGRIIAETYATAQGPWMTTDFVPFTAVLRFDKPDYGDYGFLILRKANPSGLPRHDDAVEIRVRF